MSDGPHKSLGMGRKWKKVAKFAERPAFSAEEVHQAVASAFATDWRADVPDGLTRRICDILNPPQPHLLPDHSVAELERLRPLTAGRGVAGVFLDSAIKVASTKPGENDPVIKAGTQTLLIWGERRARQIEEHYRRETSANRTDRLRNRIADCMSIPSLNGLVHDLLRARQRPSHSVTSNPNDLDEGVPL